MSKKKTKTRIEKQLTTHHFDHIAKLNVVARNETPATSSSNTPKSRALSPQDKLISKDLRNTLIIIGCFVTLVVVLGIIVYTTRFLNPLLSHWNIKY